MANVFNRTTGEYRVSVNEAARVDPTDDNSPLVYDPAQWIIVGMTKKGHHVDLADLPKGVPPFDWTADGDSIREMKPEEKKSRDDSIAKRQKEAAVSEAKAMLAADSPSGKSLRLMLTDAVVDKCVADLDNSLNVDAPGDTVPVVIAR